MRSAIIGLAFKDIELIETSIAGITQHLSPSSVYVIENSSTKTEDEIKPAMLKRVAEGSLSGYFCFDENITNNAFEIAIKSKLVDFSTLDYITLTDFDLLPYDDWMAAHVTILEKHSDVFSVSVPISLDNMPAGLRSGLRPRQFEPTAVHDDFDVYSSGLHLTTVRGKDFAAFLAWQARLGVHFRDRVLEIYGRESRRLSVRSRVSPARHLTWDKIGAEREAYRAIKNARGKNRWSHDDSSPFTFYEQNGITRVHSGPLVHSPSSYKRYRLTVTNDTHLPCTVYVTRNWRDGASDGRRGVDIAAGASDEIAVLHLGWGWGSVDLDVRWGADDGRSRRAIVRLQHADVEANPAISLGRHLVDIEQSR